MVIITKVLCRPCFCGGCSYGGGVAATMVVVGDGIGNNSFVVAVLAPAGHSGVIEMVVRWP